MLNIIQNTIGAIRRVGESVVRAGLKMWLPFTKAEPLGEELVTNGDFATDSDWDVQAGAGWIIDDGKAVNDGTAGNLSQVIPVVKGKAYIITITVSDYVSGTVQVSAGGNPRNSFTANGTYTVTQTADANTTFYIIALSGFEGSIDNVSIQEYAQETPDISGNDNDAILKTGKALQFTGNDSVQTSFPSSYTIKTIAFWINPTHSSTNETVFYGGGGMGGTRQLYLDHLQLEAINSNISMSTYVNGTFEGVTANGTPATLTQDEWQRVVLTSSTGFTVVSDTFDIASGLYGSDGRFIMSDLQIYDEAWTTDDIAYDYANPQKLVTDSEDTSITLDNLKAWWHLSEGDGTIAFDSAPLIGKELVTNGDFATNSDWIITHGGWSASGPSSGSWACDGTQTQSTNLSQPNVLQGLTSKNVVISFEITSYTTGTVRFVTGDGSIAGPDTSGVGTYEIRGVVTSGSGYNINIQANSNFVGSVSNVSIKEVFNIDGETYDGSTLGASYVDAQERIPQLGMMNWSKGSNLITYSEDFTEWTLGSNATLTYESDVVAPDGTVGVYRLLLPATANTYIQSPTFIAGSGRVFSMWAKKTDNNNTDFNFYDGTTASSTFTTTDDWQRFEMISASGNTGYIINHGDTFITDIYIWGAQIESSTGMSVITASAYRRTNGSAVTDATLISCATDSQKDILGNAVRVKGSGFNLDGTGYAEVLDDNDFDIPASSTQNGGAFSICGWAKWKYVQQGGLSSLNTIYSNGLPATDVNNFSINSRLLNGNNVVSAWVSGSGKNSSTTYTQGEWFYFALTRQVTTGSCKLYTSRIDSNGQWVVALDGTTTNTDSLINSGNKKIGWDERANDRRYHERIDDIKFYDRELSLDEIEQNFNATKSGHNN